jgi:hypothetical protein
MALTVMLLLPWGYRNKQVVGAWVWTTTNTGVTLWDGLHAGANGSSNQSSLGAMTDLREMTEVERTRELSRRAAEFARANPVEAIRLAVRKVARTWSPVPLSAEFGSNPRYLIVALLFAVPFDLLVLWGLCGGSLPRPAKVFLMAPAIYFTIAHAVTVGSLRYRIPAEVPMAIIAACGIRKSVSR